MVDLVKKYRIPEAIEELKKIDSHAFADSDIDIPLEHYFDPTLLAMVRIRGMRSELYMLDHPHYTDVEKRDICLSMMKEHEELPVIADRLRIQYRHLIMFIRHEPKLYAIYRHDYQKRGDEIEID